MNNIRILFFANLQEVIGKKHVDLEISPNTEVGELKHLLGEQYPMIDSLMPFTVVAVNHQFAFDSDTIPDGAEVALFPAVSGGSDGSLPTFCQVTEDVLQIDELVKKIVLPGSGAVAVFTGLVRETTERGEARQTTKLEYDSYVPMAEIKMYQVADEIRERWPSIHGIVLVQRIGTLLPGTPTVLIACSAGHRDTGVFEAARYGIDRLKEIVPVWKKEYGPEGEEWISGNYFPNPED